ncbi:MAG: rhodanese-like domain-containing protein [Desulfarculus sp.]|nr:rhodanese-like domain-containing protein [Desulfarculus sp.]
MKDPSPRNAARPPAAQGPGHAADKTRFLLGNVLETSRELSGVVQPAKIMDTFLLMVMGPLGIGCGMVALASAEGRQQTLACRGLAPGEVQDLRGRLGAILTHFHATPERYQSLTPHPLLASPASGGGEPCVLPHMKYVIAWKVEQDYQGLLAIGDRFDGTSLGQDDLDFLSDFTASLVSSLTRALVTQNIQQLNAELEKQNDCLEKALAEAKATRRDLDKRVFHLKSLHELTSELSPVVNIDDLINAYLLMMMGTFGIGQGLILLHDRANKTVRKASRGFVGKINTLTSEEAEKLLFQCFDVSENRSLAPMSINRLTSTEVLAQAGWETKGAKGFMLVLDESFMGLLVLGPSISGDCLHPAEIETLGTYTSTFLVFLKNARFLETVQALNESLSQRNYELERTIADLTEARDKITMLERAKSHIKQVIQGERERLNRATPLDFLFLAIFSVVFGVLFNLASPNRIPLLPPAAFRPASALIEVEQARQLLSESGAVLVDARPKEFFAHRRIPGAVNLPSPLFEIVYLMKFNNLDPERPIIVYGRHISKLYDEEVAHMLRQRNHERVFILAGGLPAWEGMSYPLEP